ncbi:MAG: DUF934 domain-containing protein [Nitratireductor sp.]|nr:DUF934 domain-containing protein [Nitratireductor sp.]
MIIIDDRGFRREPQDDASQMAGPLAVVPLGELLAGERSVPQQAGCLAVDVATAVSAYAHLLDHFALIVIPFAGFGDGRGFSLATQLRRAGFAGTLRASGHVIPDQYAHARRCGFDEVAISDEQARRQLEAQWLAEVPKIGRTYQNRLRQAAHAA